MATRRLFLEQLIKVSGAALIAPRCIPFPAALDQWEFYEVGGAVMFPIYDGTGHLTTSYGCYLLKGNSCIAIRFTEEELNNHQSDSQEYIKDKLASAILMIKPQNVDLDGGPFPLPV